MKLIGICGAAGSGKDTAASALREIGFAVLALADPLREHLLRVNPLITRPGKKPRRLSAIVEEMGWDQAKRNYPEIRRLLQATGQAARDTLGDTVWLEVAHLRLRQLRRDAFPGAVVSDLRYRNEAEYIRSQGGLVVEISWPDSPFRLHGSAAKHSSEKKTIRPDLTIVNQTGQPDRLRSAIQRIAKELEEEPTPEEIYLELAPAIRQAETEKRAPILTEFASALAETL